ncbi:MAG: molybdate ABC transporter substrate-binding protein [Bacillota bacterium]|uniref:Molybdate ABC transporter substrate-binding protein n=1 Tax=Thermanaerosceptrum fracticalcis TaxID=1712410 RepID=A0A7G6E349_THEFR|nr:molybdate ABC transporter substrate-binding protein [Thermanaerosceptrum fracticalcis]QNB46503.1 molybdate ABC transporter substrate-binding protein [Thermanaerosceptrum fracticalcis]
MKKVVSVLALLALIFSTFIFGVGCTAKATKPGALTVSAAASLKDTMEEIKEIYAKENSKVEITYNFGASGALQQQIEQGAPADIFISAAPKQMDELQKKDLIVKDTRKDLLENKVVLVTPKDRRLITSFEDLGKKEVQKIAIGAPESVPAGKYAQDALTSLGIWNQIASKLVLAKDVRQVLTYVETGNVEAGIVYQTDAKISHKVQIAAVAPEKSHAPVVYPIAAIKSSKNMEQAQSFISFLASDKAKAVFEKYGFTVKTK